MHGNTEIVVNDGILCFIEVVIKREGETYSALTEQWKLHACTVLVCWFLLRLSTLRDIDNANVLEINSLSKIKPSFRTCLNACLIFGPCAVA